ncbi:MAG: tetratricopeptide repeat protein [Candidatus Hodarchaeales archaeon]|jgi:tetratricopeptide (TPR) repeat protein
MVNWKVLFALSESQTEEIELADVADLVDWDPEFQGKLISSFFDTDYHWLLALKSVQRDDVTFPSKNFLLVVGRKWSDEKQKGVPLGVLFEFSEGDLKLRAVGPQSVADKAGGDNNLLLDLVNELFDFPQKWRSKSVICGISKEEWRSIAEIIGEEPWRLLDFGRGFLPYETKKAAENFQKAFKIFTVLADINGQFHAMLALLEVALETKNYELLQERLKIVKEYAEQLGDPMLEENVLSMEGVYLYEQAQFLSAISIFEKALERSKKANMPKHVLNAYLNIGECYYRLEDYDRSLKNFDIARGLAEERNDKHNLAVSQINISKVLCQDLKRGNASSEVQASHYLKEALEEFEKNGDTKNIMITYGIFGMLEEIKQNLDSALIYNERAAEQAQILNDPLLQDYYNGKNRAVREKLYEL